MICLSTYLNISAYHTINFKEKYKLNPLILINGALMSNKQTKGKKWILDFADALHFTALRYRLHVGRISIVWWQVKSMIDDNSQKK